MNNPNFVLETDLSNRIATLVDHRREGRFVVAFCPICDHAEEAEDAGAGRSETRSASVAKIKAHMRHAHRSRMARVKIQVMP